RLALHGLTGNEIEEGAALGRDVAGGKRADVDVLSGASRISMEKRGQRCHRRERAGDLQRLAPSTPHWRQGVIVVAVEPCNPRCGRQSEVGPRLPRSFAGPTVARDGDPDQPGSLRADVRV